MTTNSAAKKTPVPRSRKPAKRAEGATPVEGPKDPPKAVPARRAPVELITDPKPYIDKDPPECDACWGIRQCTLGRIRRCRWCAAEAGESDQIPVQSKGKRSPR